MAKIGKKLLRYRIEMLEAGMKLRRHGENELNRRIDNLVETVAEMDKKFDRIFTLVDDHEITLNDMKRVPLSDRKYNSDNSDNSDNSNPSVQELLDPPRRPPHGLMG